MTSELKNNYRFLKHNAQAFSFTMIYIMSGYEKIDFMTFFDVRALKWLQNGPEGFKQ